MESLEEFRKQADRIRRTKDLMDKLDNATFVIGGVDFSQTCYEAQKYVRAWSEMKTQLNIEASDFRAEDKWSSAKECEDILERMADIERRVGL